MSEVFELRQYTLHPGRRDELIELFEREFIETQEAAGIRLVGLFRDLDRPDYFVWIRGFESMEQRKEALTRFYGGPVWKQHRDAANATMIDSDDVLLLRLVPPFAFPATLPGPALHVTVFDPAARVDAPLTLLETEPAENTFPALPVRKSNVKVALSVDPVVGDALQRMRLEPTRRSKLTSSRA